MNLKKILILVIVLIGIFVAVLYFSKEPISNSNETINVVENLGREVTYIDNENSQQLKVIYYDNNTAVIYPNDVNEVVFNATTSESGTRYANSQQGLMIWNNENEISLYLNDSIIFSGTEMIGSIE
jgi:membrane-bound inhibitor of C-type lysozyme